MRRPAGSRPLQRCNLGELELEEVQAHEGSGRIRFARVAQSSDLAGECNFIDLAELPTGASIGLHTHAPDEEEFYLVLSGTGCMTLDQERFQVRAGDLVRNRPGGSHSLVNTGSEPLRIFVFELRVPL